MIQRLNSYIYRFAAAFLAALFAWILIRSGNIIHLVVAAALCAAIRFHEPTRELRDRVVSALAVVPGPFGLALAVLLAFGLRLGWGLHYGVELSSDFIAYFKDAATLAAGDTSIIGSSKSPTTIIFYAALFRWFGATLHVVCAANAVGGALQVWIIYAIVRRVSRSAAPAVLAALVLAVNPAVVSYYAAPNSELLFSTMFLLIILHLVRWTGRQTGRALVTAALVGVEVGVLHLTRNSGILLGGAMLALAVLAARVPVRARVTFAAVVVAVTAVTLTPQVIYNYRTLGYFSIQSSQFSALNLLSGTNMRWGGEHNRQDAGWLNQRRRTSNDWRAISRDMRRIAIGRITDEPGRFAVFALTTKFDTMWCDDGYGASGLRRSDDREATTIASERWRARINVFYMLTLVLAMLGTCTGFGAATDRRTLVALVGGAMFVTFALHVFIEVQPRYHFITAVVLPLLTAGLLIPSHNRDEPDPQLLT